MSAAPPNTSPYLGSGTPRCALWPRELHTDTLPHIKSGVLSVSGRTQGGFTLLELIVVLFLAGLVVALVAPSFTGTLDSSRLRSGAAEVRSVFTLARTLAASGSKARTVAFDVQKGEFSVLGEARTYVLPEGVRIESARVGGAVVEKETFLVRFYPDGSAERAEIVVSSSTGGRFRVTVEPLTGIAEAVS
jgi:prepilin-type N-terminal cleavage/methylation domain-containing protein